MTGNTPSVDRHASARSAGGDLSAVIGQSAADKLFASPSYPLTLVEYNNPFHSFTSSGAFDDGIILAPDQVSKLLNDAASIVPNYRSVKNPPKTGTDETNLQVLAGTSPVIESARACLSARQGAEASGSVFDGPTAAEMGEILNGGIEGLATVRGIQFKGWLSHLHVEVRDAPGVSLGGPRIALTNVHVA